MKKLICVIAIAVGLVSCEDTREADTIPVDPICGVIKDKVVGIGWQGQTLYTFKVDLNKIKQVQVDSTTFHTFSIGDTFCP